MNIKKISLILFCTVLFSNIATFSSEITEPKKSVNVHGMRVADGDEPFELMSSEKNLIDGKIQIVFVFNQGVNLNTVNGTTVKINNNPISMSETEFLFSKDGKRMRMTFKNFSNNFTITMEGIKSFSEKTLEKVEMKF